MQKLQPDFFFFFATFPLTFSARALLILPDVFVVADFRLFHSGVPVHFVDDYPKSQEINLYGCQNRDGKQMSIYLENTSDEFSEGSRFLGSL